MGRGRAALLAVGVAMAAWLASSPWTAHAVTAASRPDSDFQILWAAGQGLADGADVTDPEVLDTYGRRAGREPTPFSASQPLVARLFGLLPADDFDGAFGLWLALHAACGVGAIVALALALRGAGEADAVAPALALAAVGLTDALPFSLAMNSTNLVALLAVCASLACAVRGRSTGEGLWLGVAVLTKSSPALLVLAALFAGRVRTALVAVATWLAAGVLSVAWLGWAPHGAWLARTAPRLGYGARVPAGGFDNALHLWNLSPHGLISRAAHDADLPRLTVVVGASAVALLVVWQLVLLARSRRTPRDALALGAAAVAGSFLVSSVTWPHHLVFASVPVALCLARWSSARVPAAWGIAAGAVLAAPVGLFGEGAAGGRDGTMRCVAAVVLFAAVCALPARETEAPATESVP